MCLGVAFCIKAIPFPSVEHSAPWVTDSFLTCLHQKGAVKLWNNTCPPSPQGPAMGTPLADLELAVGALEGGGPRGAFPPGGHLPPYAGNHPQSPRPRLCMQGHNGHVTLGGDGSEPSPNPPSSSTSTAPDPPPYTQPNPLARGPGRPRQRFPSARIRRT